MSIQVKKNRLEHIVEVQVAGHIDSGIVAEFEELLKGAVGEEKNVVLNLAELTFISSAGLRIILGLGKVLNIKGGKVYLCHVPPQIMKVFEMTGMTTIFSFVNDAREIKTIV